MSLRTWDDTEWGDNVETISITQIGSIIFVLLMIPFALVFLLFYYRILAEGWRMIRNLFIKEANPVLMTRKPRKPRIELETDLPIYRRFEVVKWA